MTAAEALTRAVLEEHGIAHTERLVRRAHSDYLHRNSGEGANPAEALAAQLAQRLEGYGKR